MLQQRAGATESCTAHMRGRIAGTKSCIVQASRTSHLCKILPRWHLPWSSTDWRSCVQHVTKKKLLHNFSCTRLPSISTCEGMCNYMSLLRKYPWNRSPLLFLCADIHVLWLCRCCMFLQQIALCVSTSGHRVNLACTHNYTKPNHDHMNYHKIWCR